MHNSDSVLLQLMLQLVLMLLTLQRTVTIFPSRTVILSLISSSNYKTRYLRDHSNLGWWLDVYLPQSASFLWPSSHIVISRVWEPVRSAHGYDCPMWLMTAVLLWSWWWCCTRLLTEFDHMAWLGSIILTVHCACYTRTVTSLLLLTHLSAMLDCILSIHSCADIWWWWWWWWCGDVTGIWRFSHHAALLVSVLAETWGRWWGCWGRLSP